MERLDFTSIVIAGAIGALLLSVTDAIRGTGQGLTSGVAYGFAIGAGVQIGVRLLGVS
jgi:hypothetical protein